MKDVMRGKDRQLTYEDQQTLSRRAIAQKVKCSALLSSLENEVDVLDLFDDNGGWVFLVDNLTEEDKAEAAECGAVAARFVQPALPILCGPQPGFLSRTAGPALPGAGRCSLEYEPAFPMGSGLGQMACRSSTRRRPGVRVCAWHGQSRCRFLWGAWRGRAGKGQN
jgi:hypothetical protein